MIKKVLFFVLFIVLLSSFLGLYIKNLFLPVSSSNKTVSFVVSKGSSVSQIANNLYKEKLIKNPIAFKFVVQITNSQNKIQSGEFLLSPSLSLTQILETLKKGPTEVWVTIPEGLRREEVAKKFATVLNKDESFLNEFMTLTADKEGYLFPDTYLFPKSASATQIVNKMTSTFEKKMADITYEQVIVSSLLERETFSDTEKPIVAGILFKRVKNDWPIQVDATLQYARDTQRCKKDPFNCKYWEPVYSADKEILSPYNTYKNLGFPPGPISSAGLSSLKASTNPEDSDYWYYIHDNDGKIHFARTLEEHNSNISKYLN